MHEKNDPHTYIFTHPSITYPPAAAPPWPCPPPGPCTTPPAPGTRRRRRWPWPRTLFIFFRVCLCFRQSVGWLCLFDFLCVRVLLFWSISWLVGWLVACCVAFTILKKNKYTSKQLYIYINPLTGAEQVAEGGAELLREAREEEVRVHLPRAGRLLGACCFVVVGDWCLVYVCVYMMYNIYICIPILLGKHGMDQ